MPAIDEDWLTISTMNRQGDGKGRRVAIHAADGNIPRHGPPNDRNGLEEERRLFYGDDRMAPRGPRVRAACAITIDQPGATTGHPAQPSAFTDNVAATMDQAIAATTLLDAADFA